MRIKANSRYAISAVLYLAQVPRGEIVTLKALSEKLSIPLAYLAQVFNQLKEKDIVFSYKGPGGGYKLNKLAKDISLADILLATGNSVKATLCDGKEDCNNGEKCRNHDMWTAVNSKLEDCLQSISLEYLAKKTNNFDISNFTTNTVRTL